MNRCLSNCSLASLKIYFTVEEHDAIDSSRSTMESPDLYVSPEGYIDLTREARMFMSIMNNDDMRLICKVNKPSDNLCDYCYKQKVEPDE